MSWLSKSELRGLASRMRERRCGRGVSGAWEEREWETGRGFERGWVCGWRLLCGGEGDLKRRRMAVSKERTKEGTESARVRPAYPRERTLQIN